MTVKIGVKSRTRSEMIDITPLVQKEVTRSGIMEGLCIVYIPHTTAGVTINEGADPSVCGDILNKLNRLVPQDEGYRHAEGNSDSHIKASLTGSSVTVIIENNSLVLGTWQKIFFCEFDGARSRNINIKIINSY
ncbi:MAG: secondary thiamine-phosphate synthase enzyme YjbQ [Desulfobacteraceae bacterium]|jgi:secondary thiamine-phosphate synthase enzyme